MEIENNPGRLDVGAQPKCTMGDMVTAPPKQSTFNGQDHPTLNDYDKTEFKIDRTTLMGYNGKGGAVKIPMGIKKIGDKAFKFCDSVTSIALPDGVTSIGNNAFGLCVVLTSIDIPNSVTNIGRGAFYGCSSLTDIEIPNDVEHIGWMAFNGCRGLSRVKMPKRFESKRKYIFGDRYKEIEFTFTR